MPTQDEEITQLLNRWSNGDLSALDELIPIVYAELKRRAKRYMGKERSDHTLQTSALINEAYLKLVDNQSTDWKGRNHFFAVATKIMRNILVDHARKYLYTKRGGGAEKVPLEEAEGLSIQGAEEFVALDEALKELEAFDPRRGQLMELRYFGGLTIEETAEVTGLATATVSREQRLALAWLQKTITGKEPAKK